MFVKFVKDDKTIEEVSISSEMIPFPTDIVDQQITWTEHPQEYSDAMLAYRKHVKESAKCGLKEAKDFVDIYCDYVL